MITALPFLENQGVGFFRRGCNKKSSVCRELGARSAGLEPATFSVRSQTHSRTGGDREGHRETKPRFYRNRALLKGQGRTGRDTGLWYRCGMKGERHSLGYPVSRKPGARKELRLSDTPQIFSR